MKSYVFRGVSQKKKRVQLRGLRYDQFSIHEIRGYFPALSLFVADMYCTELPHRES